MPSRDATSVLIKCHGSNRNKKRQDSSVAQEAAKPVKRAFSLRWNETHSAQGVQPFDFRGAIRARDAAQRPSRSSQVQEPFRSVVVEVPPVPSIRVAKVYMWPTPAEEAGEWAIDIREDGTIVITSAQRRDCELLLLPRGGVQYCDRVLVDDTVAQEPGACSAQEQVPMEQRKYDFSSITARRQGRTSAPTCASCCARGAGAFGTTWRRRT